MPNSDCGQDYIRCKSKCFDVLVENLSLAGDDLEKIADAREKYKKCRSLCKAAKAICDEAGD
jgi:hypothetical protein